MTPSGLTDDELLRHYDDLFRQHPATAELADRFHGSEDIAQLETELGEALESCRQHEARVDELFAQREALAEALEDYLDDTSAANAKAARKVLDGLK